MLGFPILLCVHYIKGRSVTTDQGSIVTQYVFSKNIFGIAVYTLKFLTKNLILKTSVRYFVCFEAICIFMQILDYAPLNNFSSSLYSGVWFETRGRQALSFLITTSLLYISEGFRRQNQII